MRVSQGDARPPPTFRCTRCGVAAIAPTRSPLPALPRAVPPYLFDIAPPCVGVRPARGLDA